MVCSDPTAGGRHENEDIRISELECPVSTDPSEIARSLRGDGPTRVVFCTYHSLQRVTEAQADHGAPEFDLAIADEAHRTTGALRGSNGAGRVNFQEFHDGERLLARRRLYMTATPRIYTVRSKSTLASKGIDVVDMGDQQVYGPQVHLLPFAKAVKHRVLSDYRVIVLGVGQASVTPGLRRRLEDLSPSTSRKNAPTTNDMTRVLGVSLAVNGVTEGTALEQPGQLPRTLAFANSIVRSKWYAEALMESEVLRATTRRMSDGRAMKVVAKHLDASASALQRNQELRALAHADRDGECRVVCNVKLFTEGVDVPSLDAVAFLEARDSQVDVVQAVGRVMRKAPGKRFGYIIIPVIIEPGRDVAAALEKGTEGYRTVGRVLRALQAHDGRLAETPANFIRVYEPTRSLPPDVPEGGMGHGTPENRSIQRQLDLKEAEQGIYAHVAAASGLGKPGQLVADEIADAVRRASTDFQDEELEWLLVHRESDRSETADLVRCWHISAPGSPIDDLWPPRRADSCGVIGLVAASTAFGRGQAPTSNSERGRRDWRMIDIRVPTRSSRWSGTGTVSVPSASAFCMAMWLPRRRTSTKPWAAKMRQASRPDRTRSLANRNLDLSYVDFASQAPVDLAGRRGLEEQGKGLREIVASLGHGLTLARNVQLGAERHIALTLALDDRSQASGHCGSSMGARPKTRLASTASAMASRRFVRASSREAPWVLAPGNSSMKAMWPSGTFRKTAMHCRSTTELLVRLTNALTLAVTWS